MPTSQTDFTERVNNRITKHNGLSLIEVLVALVIFATGFLGIASFQIKLTQSQQFNNQISDIKRVTSQLINRINLNKTSVLQSENQVNASPYLQPNAYELTSFSPSSTALNLSCDANKYPCFCMQLPVEIAQCRSLTSQSTPSCNAQSLASFDSYEIGCLLALVSNQTKVVVTRQQSADKLTALKVKVYWDIKKEVEVAGLDKTNCDYLTNNADSDYKCYSQSWYINGASYEG